MKIKWTWVLMIIMVYDMMFIDEGLLSMSHENSFISRLAVIGFLLSIFGLGYYTKEE